MAKLSVRDLDLAGKRVFLRVDFNVPLVFAPRGGIKVLKREDLLNLLEQLDQTENQTAGIPEETHAPL